MEVKTFRENIFTRTDPPRHRGEDAKPYINDFMLMVADGMGGKAGIPRDFNRKILDKDKFLDTVFEGVYEDYSNEKFREYVFNSFADFFEVSEEEYFGRTDLFKKGGYFGSRFATAIILHEVLYNKARWKTALWDDIHAAKSVDEIEKIENEIGKYFADLILEKLKKIDENVGFSYAPERNANQNRRLGTTLCANFYNDCGDFVEAFYLHAGDSRPFLCDQDGLAQILKDQEDEKQVTNAISTNIPFEIVCRYRRFAKPCILFNASDGCFDAAPFAEGFRNSQLGFEKLILECILNKDTLGKDPELDWDSMDEEMRIGEQLRCFFEYPVNHMHDDAATISMKSFGFKDFEEIKAFAEKRLQEIEESYLKEMPELLETSYVLAENSLTIEEKNLLMPKRAMVWAEKGVQEYCIDKVQKGAMPVYNEAVEKAEEEIKEIKNQISAKEQEALPLINRYYLSILEAEGKKDSKKYKKAYKTANDCLQKAQKALDDMHDEADTYQEEFDKAKDILVKSLMAVQPARVDDIYSGKKADIIVDEDKKAVDASLLKPIFELQKNIKNLLEGFASGKGTYSKTITSSLQKYFKLNESFASKDNQEDYKAELNAQKNNTSYQYVIGPSRLAENLVQLASSGIIEKAVFITEDKEKLLSLANEINEEKKKIQRIREPLEELLLKCAERYWAVNFVEVMRAVYAKEVPNVSEECKAELDEIFSETEKRGAEIRKMLAKQDELFAKYEVSYTRVLDMPTQLSEQAKKELEGKTEEKE